MAMGVVQATLICVQLFILDVAAKYKLPDVDVLLTSAGKFSTTWLLQILLSILHVIALFPLHSKDHVIALLPLHSKDK